MKYMTKILMLVLSVSLTATASVTVHLKVDSRTGARVPSADGEVLCYDASWYENGDEIRITDNGNVVVTGAVGSCVWYPRVNCSVNDLKLEVLSNGEVVATETAQFALGYVRNVTVRQLWPHNKVEVCYDLAEDIGEVADLPDNTIPQHVFSEDTTGVGWTCSSSAPSSWTASDKNLILGIDGEFTGTRYSESGRVSSSDPISRLTDGAVNTSGSTYDNTYAIKSGTLTWTLPCASSLSRIRINSHWGDGGRDGIYITSIKVKRVGSDTWDTLPNSAVTFGNGSATSGDLQAVYCNAEGTVFADEVTAVCFELPDQENIGAGFTEFEIVGERVITPGGSELHLMAGSTSARTIIGDSQCLPGSHRIVWDSEKDGFAVNQSNLLFMVAYATTSNTVTGCANTTGAVYDGMCVDSPMKLDYSPIYASSVSLEANGRTLMSSAAPGTYEWTPERPGTYVLTHRVGTNVFTRCVVCTNGTDMSQLELGWFDDMTISNLFPNIYASVTNVVILPSVRSLAKDTFAGCVGLGSDELGLWILDGWVLGYNGEAPAEVTVPEGVVGIATDAFAGQWDLKNVVLPDTLKYIGARAFAECTSLEEMWLPNGVETVGDEAFLDCTWMQEVVFPSSLTEIGAMAFANCSMLDRIECPDDLKTVGEGAFSNCWRMISVALPVSVDAVGDNAFYNCKNLTGVTIPTHVKTVAELFPSAYQEISSIAIADGEAVLINGIFAGCSEIEEVILFDEITAIPDNAFSGCANLQTIAFPANLTRIGANAFAQCSMLLDLPFNDRLETIGDGAFCGLSRVEKLVLPTSLTSIGASAFSGLSGLTEVNIPAGVTNISVNAFAGCASVRGVTVPGNLLILSSMFPASYGSLTNVVVNDGTKELMASLFEGCSKLSDITLPSSVTNIGARCFKNCKALTESCIPNNVTALGSEAFSGCSSMLTVALPSGLTKIGDSAFAYCTSFSSIVMPATLSTLGTKVFNGCSALKSVSYLGSCPTFDEYCYAGTRSDLQSFVLMGSCGWDGVATSKVLPETWPTSYARAIAYWTPNTFTVTFDGNGGTPATTSIGQTTGMTYQLPAEDPTQPGAQFAGWWTEKINGGEIKSVTKIEVVYAQTFYAHWRYNTYTVSFNANGGSGTIGEIGMTVNTATTLPKNDFYWRDHDFAGWALEPGGAVVYVDGASVSNLTYEAEARVTLYAVWNERKWNSADYLNASGCTFTSTGDAEWVPDCEVTHDGIGSMRSGEISAAAEEGGRTSSKLRTTVHGKGTGSFWWKVDCEPAEGEDYYDYAVFTIDGEVVSRIAGTVDWTNVTYEIADAGDHVLEWEFTRDDWDEDGADYANAAWVDEFVWTPATVVISFDAGGASGTVPSTLSLKSGDTFVMPSADGLVYAGKTFAGWSDGENVHAPGESLIVEGDDITLTAVWEANALTLEVAANVTNLTLSTGGDVAWSIDQTVSHDGEAALKSGTVVTSQTTWVETQVNGSGTLSFWWKSEGYTYRGSAANFVQCLVDDVSVAKVATCDWTNLCVTVSGAGTHTIRWSYTHKRTQSSGVDAAWLDQIEWVGDNSDPLPDLTNPTSEQVKEVLDAASDSRVAANITNKTCYASFRTWANQVKVQDGTALAGPSSVMSSPHAWLSYALDSATLLTEAPQQGDMAIAVFTKGSTTGAYDFQISVDGITIGTGTTAANLATIFSLEGCSTVNGNYQPLAVTFGTPVDGKVMVTAQPTGTSFFIKAKMKP